MIWIGVLRTRKKKDDIRAGLGETATLVVLFGLILVWFLG